MRLGTQAAFGAAVVTVALSVTVETQGTADARIAKARQASGADFEALLGVTCDLIKPPSNAEPAPAAPSTAGSPARASWHAEPAKVFDNVYFVGDGILAAQRSCRGAARAS